MPDVTINTQSAQYQQRLAQWNDIVGALRPRIRRYASMPPSVRDQWRQLDPLIDSVLTFAERIDQLMVEEDTA